MKASEIIKEAGPGRGPTSMPVPKQRTAADLPPARTPAGEIVGSLINPDPGIEDFTQAAREKNVPAMALAGVTTAIPGGKLLRKGVSNLAGKVAPYFKKGEKAAEKVPPKSKLATDDDRILDFNKPDGGLPAAALDATKPKPGLARRAADATLDMGGKALKAGGKAVGRGILTGLQGAGLAGTGYVGYKALFPDTPADKETPAAGGSTTPAADGSDTSTITGKDVDNMVKQKTDDIYNSDSDDRQSEIDFARQISGNQDIKEEANRLDPKVLAAIQQGIYGNESSYGKAKTDKPNYAGARGPMQILPGTFSDFQKIGVIPKDYDIKNPEQNREAGKAIIAHYYNKYQGDPAKVFAAYYAGAGSIRKDGTINAHWVDSKNPNAPNVGQYIEKGLARSGLSNYTYVPYKPVNTQLATVKIGGDAKPSTLSVADLTKDQTSLAALVPTYKPAILSPAEKQDSASHEASRLAAVAKAADQFNKQYAAKNSEKPEELSESKKVQVNESINTNADLIDLLRLAGRRKI